MLSFLGEMVFFLRENEAIRRSLSLPKRSYQDKIIRKCLLSVLQFGNPKSNFPPKRSNPGAAGEKRGVVLAALASCKMTNYSIPPNGNHPVETFRLCSDEADTCGQSLCPTLHHPIDAARFTTRLQLGVWGP